MQQKPFILFGQEFEWSRAELKVLVEKSGILPLDYLGCSPPTDQP
jgi:hypothetical protein